MDPIDYTSTFASLPTAGASLLQGVQAGATIGALQLERAQKEQAAQLAQQQRDDLSTLSKNPTPSAIGALMIKYPALSEQLKRGSDVMTTAQQQSRLDNAAPVYAAVQSGANAVAQRLLKEQAAAARNSGQEQAAKAAETMAQLITDHPEFAKLTMGTSLAASMGPEKFTEAFGKFGSEQRAQELQPSAVRSANAKAGEAETDATQKVFAAVGSTLGSLQGKNASKAQVQTALKTLASRGTINGEQLSDYVNNIPDEPKARDEWLGSLRMAGLKPEDQAKYFSPDANATLQANTSVRTAGISAAASRYGADKQAQSAADRLEFDKDKESGKGQGLPTDLTASGKTGNEFLAMLDKPVSAQVKALAEGRMAFPVGRAAQSDYWQKMISAVAQYDPSFDAVNYSARSKARNDLVAGKTGGNIKALNTAIAHMGQLNDQLTALDNGDIPAVNVARNWAAKAFGMKDRQNKIAAANTTAEGVAGEMAKVFRETGMSEHEINAWREKFVDSTTPAAQKGTFKSAMHMLNGRIDAIQDQYKTGMGTTAAPLDILTEKSKAIFDNLMDEPHAAAPAKAATKAPAAKPAAAPALPGGWTVREH